MDRLERFDSFDATMLTALQGAQADLWTALPGIIQGFDPVTQTCTIQPSLRIKISDPAFRTYKSATKIDDPSGKFCWDKMPLLLDCPVVFPSGGGFTLTFPLAAGDECLVVFASRCIDAWWYHGGIQNQAAVRMHDLSDGFCIPGPKSQPRRLENISASAVQLRSDDGATFVEVGPGKIRIVADEVVINGRDKAIFGSGGTGVAYQPNKVDNYTIGVPSEAHEPNPPEVPE